MRATWVSISIALGLMAACGGDTVTTAIPLPDGGGNGFDSGNKLDGSASPDGGIPDAPNDSTLDSGLVTGSIACGVQTCALPSQSCCVDIGPPLVEACTGGDAGACAQGLVELQCRSAVDCASNNVCCIDANVDPAIATCQSTCDGMNRATLCDPKASPKSNKCGDAGACGNANIDTWGLTKSSGTCGDTMGPF